MDTLNLDAPVLQRLLYTIYLARGVDNEIWQVIGLVDVGHYLIFLLPIRVATLDVVVILHHPGLLGIVHHKPHCGV